jgi:haloalkane dehalogenase
VIPADATFAGTWPYRPHFHDVSGSPQHYVDEGAGQPVVMLHGEPTWGYLFRHLIGPMSRSHRVVVPDHFGFGKSATPADFGYWAHDHVRALSCLLVDRLDLRDITLVLHDWGGPLGAAFALQHPDRIARIFATNTVLPVGLPEQNAPLAANRADSDWFRWATAAQADGSFEEILGNGGHTVVHLMLALQRITHPEIVTPTWIEAYASHFRSRADCLGLIRFPQQIVAPKTMPAPDPATLPAAPAPGAQDLLRRLPAMLAEGMADRALLPQHSIELFRAVWPDAPVVELADCGHFTPEDCPATILALLQQFLATT